MSSVSQKLLGWGPTERQLHYWIMRGAIVPSLGSAKGSGYRHQWSEHDIDKIKAIGLIQRDLARLGAELTMDGVRRLWSAFDNDRAIVRCGTVIISVDLHDPRIDHELEEVS